MRRSTYSLRGAPIETRSMPEQKWPPAPVSTPHITSSVSSMYVYASASPTSIGALNALRFSGRFIVMITTPPSRSTMQFSVEAGRGSGMAAHRTEQRHEIVEVAHAHAVEVGVVVERIDEHGMDPGRARAGDV